MGSVARSWSRRLSRSSRRREVINGPDFLPLQFSDGDRRRLELAYSLMFTLPGTPVLRYGDELGMGDDLKLPERNCARTAMQWSNEPHGGFTKSDKPHIPVISGGPYGFAHINAAIQRRHPESLLNWTERIIRMRKEVPEVGLGQLHTHTEPRPGGACDAVRLAQQLGVVRAQSGCQAARGLL